MSCRRKLFQYSSVPREFSTVKLVTAVLGEPSEVKEWLKYRRLHKEHPYDTSFKNKHDTCLAIVTTKVSKNTMT